MITQLISTTAKGRRPQIPMKAEYITIHSTGNPRSTAKNEAMNVINNNPGMKVSFHIAVDEKEAYNVIPLNEIAWHAGDGEKGPGNRTSIGIEICELGDREKTLLNAASVVRELMASQGIGIDHIVQHNHWSGKDCPRILRNPTYIKDGLDWNWFLTQLDETAEAERTIKEKTGLNDATIDYLAKYKYGKDLLLKLAKAMR